MSDQNSAPFEGPEKLLEIWFAPSPNLVPDAATGDPGRTGLRKVDPKVWEEMLDIVRCKVLSTVRGREIDAYLLSESSFFISPHRLILKTCGTTLNLLGLPRILQIASTEANMHSVHRCFYSRKSFMFPERQQGPHRDWKDEVQYLDNIFTNGAAYTIGKVNGDHWLLYITNPDHNLHTSPPSPIVHSHQGPFPDYTIEILMSDLSPEATHPFSSSTLSPSESPSAHAQSLSQSLGISDIFPRTLTTIDAYTFTPCGYSSNALIRWGDDPSFFSAHQSAQYNSGEGYYTIHVTPEEGWSYASFECNVPLPHSRSDAESSIPDLKSLVQRVVRVFQPGRITLTLFISSEENETDENEEDAVELAQRAFKAALVRPFSDREGESTGKLNSFYKRTDKINYEFGGYDLAFASFEAVK